MYVAQIPALGEAALGEAVLGEVAAGEVAAVSEGTMVGLYLVYAVIALGLVVWLGRTLYANGSIFLRDVFDDQDLARAVNHLLVVGFYLLNLGFALMLHQVAEGSQTLTGAVNELFVKIGTLLLSLGVIHLLNMMVFWRIRTRNDRRSGSYQMPSMPAPSGFMPPPPPPSGGPGVVAPA